MTENFAGLAAAIDDARSALAAAEHLAASARAAAEKAAAELDALPATAAPREFERGAIAKAAAEARAAAAGREVEEANRELTALGERQRAAAAEAFEAETRRVEEQARAVDASISDLFSDLLPQLRARSAKLQQLLDEVARRRGVHFYAAGCGWSQLRGLGDILTQSAALLHGRERLPNF